MASVIQALILKYRPEIDKLQNWQNTSDEKKAEALKLQKLAQALMTLIVLDIIPSNKAATLSQNALKKICTKLLEQESKTRKVRLEFFKKVLGKFVDNQLESHSNLSGLKEQFELIFQEEDLEQSSEDGAAQMSVLEQDEMEELNAFFFNLPSSESTKSSSFHNYSHQSNLRYPAVADKSFQTWGNDIHSMTVLTYLKEISAPQTELTYLCQAMAWRVTFIDRSGGDGLFQVVAQVDFEFGKVKQLLQESFVAKNKKMGRVFASIKTLKKIYINFPQIWDMYGEKRKKKSLAIDKSSLNPLLFPAEVLNERVQPIASKVRDSELIREKEAYMNNISSFKSQYNLLNQQHPGVVSLKVADKAQVGSKWQVRCEMIIKFKGKEVKRERADSRGSAKAAQQQVFKQLVIQAYDLFPEILQMMAMLKNKRIIRT